MRGWALLFRDSQIEVMSADPRPSNFAGIIWWLCIRLEPELNRFHFTQTETWGVFTSGTWTQIWAHLDIGLVSVNTIGAKINRRQVWQFDPGGRRLDNVVVSSLYSYLCMRFERDSAKKEKTSVPPYKNIFVPLFSRKRCIPEAGAFVIFRAQ